MARLSQATLGGLPAEVIRPAYDRAALKTGIVHLGIGAFHRAQEAVFTEGAIAAGDLDWGICGASLRSADTRDALKPQDGLYTVAVRGPAGEQLQVIGAVKNVVVGVEDPGALIGAMTDPRVRIVSLTVTEKGYCHDPATGRLNDKHPDIVQDIANPRTPRSAPGYLVEALRRRRDEGTAPFTVLCCDNLPHNGATVAGIVRDLAELHDKDLAKFIAAEVAFPSTMVDRIVPATTDADRAAITQRLGVKDAWPIVTEPYNYWAVEDRFPAGRPDWPGVEFVTDIAPYEAMKLRLLNASHSVMAYLGYLAGHETIAETIADPVFLRLVEGLMDVEVTPTLKLPAGTDVAAYKRALIERFANPALKHRTWQIAMDGSQKLPQRILGTVRDRLAGGASINRLALGVAGWMRYVTGLDERGQPIDVRDPLADKLRTVAGNAGPNAARLAPMLLEVREVFGELGADARFREAVTKALTLVFEKGAKGAVAAG